MNSSDKTVMAKPCHFVTSSIPLVIGGQKQLCQRRDKSTLRVAIRFSLSTMHHSGIYLIRADQDSTKAYQGDQHEPRRKRGEKRVLTTHMVAATKFGQGDEINTTALKLLKSSRIPVVSEIELTKWKRERSGGQDQPLRAALDPLERHRTCETRDAPPVL